MVVHVDFGLLGPLTVRCQGAVVPIARGRQRVLLAALLLEAGQLVKVSQLIDVIWGATPPASAVACLHNQVSRLRDGLGEVGRTRVLTQPGGYTMHLEPGELDVARMQALVMSAQAAARDCAWNDASAVAASAMLLWRGEPLADVGSKVLARRIPQLTEIYLQAVDVKLEADRKLGHGAVYQAGSRIRGGEREGEAVPAVPRELPGTAAHFTGRTAELAALTDLLDDNAKCIVISASDGTAGVGKSSLAAAWAHQVAARFPDGQVYVDLGGNDVSRPVACADTLAGLLRSLGVPAQDIPPGEDERAARYRRLLAGQKILIVLDNARDESQVRPLLPVTDGSVAVVTSRDTLSRLVARGDTACLDLGPLPLADAVSLLHDLIGERAVAGPEALGALAVACSRMPLALRLAAELAAGLAAELAVSQPGGSIAALISELAEQRRLLELLDAGTDAQIKVQAVFRRAYRGLDPASARAFRLIGLHPGRNLDRYAVAALTGYPVEQADRVLDVLARAYLVLPAGPDRYSVHDLLRDYGRGLAAAHDSRSEEQLALTRLLDLYLAAAAAATDTLAPAERRYSRDIAEPCTPLPPFADEVTALAWLDAERDSLVAVAALAAGSHWPGHATRLSATMFGYLELGGYLAEATRICGHARYAAARTGDRSGEATALLGLAVVDYRQGRYQRSARHLRQALARYRKAGDQTGETQVRAHLCLIEEKRSSFGNS
jgi:tetratricopeptide (TPR) repeat protein